jgi:hypothetical protein
MGSCGGGEENQGNMNTGKKGAVDEILIRGRHLNLSVILSSQKYMFLNQNALLKGKHSEIQMDKNFVLNIKISSLNATTAKIEWVEGKKEDQFFPIKLDQSKKQTEARIVIASYRIDDRYRPGVSNKEKIKTDNKGFVNRLIRQISMDSLRKLKLSVSKIIEDLFYHRQIYQQTKAPTHPRCNQ